MCCTRQVRPPVALSRRASPDTPQRGGGSGSSGGMRPSLSDELLRTPSLLEYARELSRDGSYRQEEHVVAVRERESPFATYSGRGGGGDANSRRESMSTSRRESSAMQVPHGGKSEPLPTVMHNSFGAGAGAGSSSNSGLYPDPCFGERLSTSAPTATLNQPLLRGLPAGNSDAVSDQGMPASPSQSEPPPTPGGSRKGRGSRIGRAAKALFSGAKRSVSRSRSTTPVRRPPGSPSGGGA